MASISQALVLTTAMLFSTTLLYLAFSTHNPSPPFQFLRHSNPSHSHNPKLRSCLYSEEKKRERREKNKKKKVKFAENVIVKEESRCRNEVQETGGMPENRIALYNGILRDRGHRMACCH